MEREFAEQMLGSYEMFIYLLKGLKQSNEEIIKDYMEEYDLTYDNLYFEDYFNEEVYYNNNSNNNPTKEEEFEWKVNNLIKAVKEQMKKYEEVVY